jgi:cytochrome c nitrite reductase small subunit
VKGADARRLRTIATLFPAAAGGILAGLVGFTFLYGKGHSYLVNDPNSCMNCHIMQDAYDAWAVGPHRSITCYDCHLPVDFPENWISKADSGFRHAWAFTFEDVQTIRPVESTLRIVQRNCLRCHEPMTGHLGVEGGMRCFDCHAETRHRR